MAEKKKKQIFKEDVSVFTDHVIKPDADLRGKRTPTGQGKSRKRVLSSDIEKALLLMKQLGFQVTVPTSEEDEKKQEDSRQKLGIKKKTTQAPSHEQAPVLTATLGTTHIIGDITYGPGEITLPLSEVDLFRSIMHQETQSRQANYDTSQQNPYSRCFIMQPGNGQDAFNKFKKVGVSEAQFNGTALWDQVAVVAGQHDVAGQHPHYNPNQTF